ncbi:hypothetical protein [Veillonella parvula]|uniref:hypothetical protein n=1 Tax=Veillonella parvula TaxID=29466 RepID=UPI0029016ADB|nr:hypothetical protein [Veillonella parvula]MDU2262045.1 hypothetical protein [Veillonella parvula]
MEKEVKKVEMSENVADPTGLGLLGLAIVCFVVSTSRVGWSGPTTSVIIPWQEKQSFRLRCIRCIRFILVRNGWSLVDPNGLLRS